MSTSETERFHIPYPGPDDQGTWFTKFATMMTQLDAVMFAQLENLKPTYALLPTVENNIAARELRQTGDWIIVSRTLNVAITVPTGSVLSLLQNHMIGVRVTAGAVGPQAGAWELWDSADIDGECQVFGYVDSSWNIYWYNGAVMAPGDVNRLFQHTGTGAGGETVKVTGADPVANYLNSKIVAGANITTAVLAPGPMGETLRISAAGPGAVLTGAGNPNGVVTGARGQVYVDTSVPGAEVFYMNTSGAMVWSVI
jgi:hypothetical protein